MQRASLAALAGLIFHYAVHYLFGTPLLTEAIAEWIMAHTPNQYSVWLLTELGAWAKPFAVTGGLATLGGILWIARRRTWLVLPLALALSWIVAYWSPLGILFFWLPAVAFLFEHPKPVRIQQRRSFLLASVMSAGTVAVAAESYLRSESLARRATEPAPLFPFQPPPESSRFSPPLVRNAVTSVSEFYGMSKNAVDPVIDPNQWRLRITIDGKPLREFRYADLLAQPRIRRYVTLRCISNTLQSNLMGNALWSGVRLDQLVQQKELPPDIVEMAVIGVDGHGDSFPIPYAFGGETLLALGMNGNTLNRTHGFPLRLLVPRYYGFKHVKWIDEIRFVRQPYLGTWPRMGYTREPAIHTCSYIDRVMRSDTGLLVGGIAFSGSRGIQRVQVRAEREPWIDAELESPLSPFTWTRWRAALPPKNATRVEARAQDGAGNWQSDTESPLFPNGVAGPTIRKVSL